jgi:hypothetical protein
LANKSVLKAGFCAKYEASGKAPPCQLPNKSLVVKGKGHSLAEVALFGKRLDCGLVYLWCNNTVSAEITVQVNVALSHGTVINLERIAPRIAINQDAAVTVRAKQLANGCVQLVANPCPLVTVNHAVAKLGGCHMSLDLQAAQPLAKVNGLCHSGVGENRQ